MEAEVTSADHKGQNLSLGKITSYNRNSPSVSSTDCKNGMGPIFKAVSVSDIIITIRSISLSAEKTERLWDKEVSESRKKTFML